MNRRKPPKYKVVSSENPGMRVEFMHKHLAWSYHRNQLKQKFESHMYDMHSGKEITKR